MRFAEAVDGAACGRRFGLLFLFLLVVGAFALTGPAAAGPVGVAAGFEDDDGDLADGAAIGIDWNSFAPVTWMAPPPEPFRQADKVALGWHFHGIEDAQATTSDSGFAGGTKQDDDCASVITAKAPNKDDLKRAYLASKVGADGHVYLTLAWARIPQNTTSPSAHIGFEFNKATSGVCGAGSDGLVKRTEGDLLVVYDFEGGANDMPVITLRRWVLAGPCEVGSMTAPCWGPAANLTAISEAEAKVNTTSTAVDALAPGGSATLGLNEFGEAGIDLTDAGIFPTTSCESFGKVFAVSRSSGNSGTAQMKDLVGPGDFNLQNCGKIIVKKVTNPSPDPTDTTFNFTAGGGLSPTSFGLKNGQTQTFADLTPGNGYSVAETVPAGWNLDSATCDDGSPVSSVDVSAGETVTCTFTNRRTVDARISLSPLTAVNGVGQAHNVTATVEQNTGSGWTAAPDGTTVQFSLLNNTAGATFVGGNACTTTGGTCSIQINSSSAGSVDIHATTTFSVLGQSLTRATGTGAPNSADANKRYVNARIALSPLEATNLVGEEHTVTATVDQDTGSGFVSAPNGTTVNFSLLNNNAGATFVGSSSCTTTSGSCSVKIVSSTAGSTDIHATTTFSVLGQSLTRATGTGAPNGADAKKTWIPPEETPCPAGSFTFSLNSGGDLVIVYDQFPAPNDNSYGVNAVGWPNGHRFNDLVGSDHAGITLKDQNGVTKLDFNVDYISAKSGTPSGYASLGPFGGDGKVNVGTLTANDITFDSSLARNLNNTGYFVGGSQSPATLPPNTNGTNLLVDSPPTMNTTDNYTLKEPNPWSAGWDFHDTYFVTIKKSKLDAMGFNPASWSVEPNADSLHNSPAKPCPAGSATDLAVTKREIKDKQVKVTITNNAATDAILTQLRLTWPQATNGNLVQIKLDGDTLWQGSVGGGSTDSLGNPVGVPPLVADQNKRKINHNSSDVLAFIFANNVAPLSNPAYSGRAWFGSFELDLGLPAP